MGAHPKLKRYSEHGIIRGIVTGRNEAFLIDGATRETLINEDPSSKEIIHPYVMGTDVQPWHILDRDRYIIFTKQGIAIQRYPAILRHLETFREILTPKQSSEGSGGGRKPGSYEWYEIQDTSNFIVHFDKPKVIWPDIAKLPRFVIDSRGSYLDATCCLVPGEDYYLLGVLSSWASWFVISKTCQPLRLRAGRWQYRLKKQWVENVPIPKAEPNEREAVAKLARQCEDRAQKRSDVVTHVQRRLAQSFGTRVTSDGLNTQASEWWTCSLNELGDALKTSFKLTANPFKNPRTADEWEPYLAEKRADVERLSRELADAEAEINDRVYRLFELTPDEIKLLQKEVEH